MFQQLSEEQLTTLYDKFMGWIKEDSRSEPLLKMYEAIGDELLLAPASGKTHFHNAWTGGYIEHILRVTDTALKIAGLYKGMEGDINFTKQELIFSAIHHDLGKLGNPDEGPYYVEQDTDWHRKRGELYRHNQNIQYMKAPER